MIDPFNKITLHRIKSFINVLALIKGSDLDFIKDKYNQVADCFTETLEFLKRIELVRENDHGLMLSDDLNYYISDENLRSQITNKLINHRCGLYEEVEQYLKHFNLINGQFIYNPLIHERLKDGNIRNLLIELGFVIYDMKNHKYMINDKYLSLFLSYINKGELKPSELNFILNQQAILGYEAEKAALTYEKNRLKLYPGLIKKIEHISLTNVNAGYDIRSFSVGSDNTTSDRYIEVKAVSAHMYQFYWSANEIEKAKLLGDNYYLYFIPVIGRNIFNLESIEMIKNPFVNVLGNSIKWKKLIESYCICKIK
ncbi:MAG: DUF3883 domain-containing protein [Patescibacteria group bacterium]